MKTMLVKINNNLLLIAFVLFTAFMFKLATDTQYLWHRMYKDFDAYLTGATLVSDNRIKELYDLEIQKEYLDKVTHYPGEAVKGVLAYRNPPILAVMLSPLAKLTYFQAYHIMLAFNLIITFLAIKLLCKTFGDKKTVVVWLLLYPPMLLAQIVGQVSPTILLLITLALVNLKKRPFVAGILAGLVLIKPHLLILSPILILLTKSKKKYLWGLLISVTAFLLVNIALYGGGFFQDYLRFLFNSENLNSGTDISFNFNIHAIYNFVTKNTVPNLNIAIMGIAAYLGILVFLSKRKMADIDKLTVGIIFGLSLNVHTMIADLMLMIIPLIAIYKGLEGSKTKVGWFVYILLFLTPWLGLIGAQWLATIITLTIATFLIFRGGSKNLELPNMSGL